MSDEQAAAATPAPADIQAAEQERVASYIQPKADLVYGPTDSGKTTQIQFASDYIMLKYGQLSRLVTADGGGAPPGLAESGQLEVWSISAWKEQLGGGAHSIVIAAIQKAVEGYWPARLDDPESVMLAPDAGTWEIYGLEAFEGLTSFGDATLMNLKSDQASLSQDPSYVWQQAGVKFAGGNRSYYGFIQDQLYSWVALSHLLPVKKVLWTALESKGDDQEGLPIYGPAIAGRKSISKAPQWFKNCLHIDMVDKPPREVAIGGTKLLVAETERVMWLKTHADPRTKINYPAKLRVPIAYVSENPGYMIPPNIAKVYELIDQLEAKQAASSSGRMSEIEAVRERLLKAAVLAKGRAEKAAVEKAKRMGQLPTLSLPGPTRAALTPPTAAQPAASAALLPVQPAAPAVAAPGSVPQIQQIKSKPKVVTP